MEDLLAKISPPVRAPKSSQPSMKKMNNKKIRAENLNITAASIKRSNANADPTLPSLKKKRTQGATSNCNPTADTTISGVLASALLPPPSAGGTTTTTRAEYACNICRLKMPTLTSMCEHLQTEHPKEWQETLTCTPQTVPVLMSAAPDTVKKKARRGSMKPPSPNSLPCPHCEVHVVSKGLKAHIQRKHPVAAVMEDILVKISSRAQPQREGWSKCLYCDSVIKKTGMISHVKKVHPEEVTTSAPPQQPVPPFPSSSPSPTPPPTQAPQTTAGGSLTSEEEEKHSITNTTVNIPPHN